MPLLHVRELTTALRYPTGGETLGFRRLSFDAPLAVGRIAPMTEEREARWTKEVPTEDGYWWAKWPSEKPYREDFEPPELVTIQRDYIWVEATRSLPSSKAREEGWLFWTLPATPPGTDT